MPPPTSAEYAVLVAIRDKLRLMTDPDLYHYPCTNAWIVPVPQTKYRGEVDTFYLVSPGDAVIAIESVCNSAITGDALVTGFTKYGGPEMPWDPDHVDETEVQLNLLRDVFTALNGYEYAGAPTTVVGRNLDLELDGWAVCQVQVSFVASEIGGQT